MKFRKEIIYEIQIQYRLEFETKLFKTEKEIEKKRKRHKCRPSNIVFLSITPKVPQHHTSEMGCLTQSSLLEILQSSFVI